MTPHITSQALAGRATRLLEKKTSLFTRNTAQRPKKGGREGSAAKRDTEDPRDDPDIQRELGVAQLPLNPNMSCHVMSAPTPGHYGASHSQCGDLRVFNTSSGAVGVDDAPLIGAPKCGMCMPESCLNS